MGLIESAVIYAPGEPTLFNGCSTKYGALYLQYTRPITPPLDFETVKKALGLPDDGTYLVGPGHIFDLVLFQKEDFA